MALSVPSVIAAQDEWIGQSGLTRTLVVTSPCLPRHCRSLWPMFSPRANNNRDSGVDSNPRPSTNTSSKVPVRPMVTRWNSTFSQTPSTLTPLSAQLPFSERLQPSMLVLAPPTKCGISSNMIPSETSASKGSPRFMLAVSLPVMSPHETIRLTHNTSA